MDKIVVFHEDDDERRVGTKYHYDGHCSEPQSGLGCTSNARSTHGGEGDSGTIASVSGGLQQRYRRRQRHPDGEEQANATRGGVYCYFETFPRIIQRTRSTAQSVSEKQTGAMPDTERREANLKEVKDKQRGAWRRRRRQRRGQVGIRGRRSLERIWPKDKSCAAQALCTSSLNAGPQTDALPPRHFQLSTAVLLGLTIPSTFSIQSPHEAHDHGY